MALGDILLRFARQAWHLWHWAGSGGALGPVMAAGDAPSLCVAHPPSFRVAGVALGHIHLRFAWQAWHLTGLALVARLGRFWSPVTPRHFA